MDAGQLAALYRQVPRPGRTQTQNDGLKILMQLTGRKVPANLHVGQKLHAGRLHESQAALDDPFFQLHVGYAVGQQAANAIRSLKHRHLVAHAIQLVGAGQAGRPGPDHRHPLARPPARPLGHDPAFVRKGLHRRVVGGVGGLAVSRFVHEVEVDGQS